MYTSHVNYYTGFYFTEPVLIWTCPVASIKKLFLKGRGIYLEAN